jgi:hypothetical protein
MISDNNNRPSTSHAVAMNTYMYQIYSRAPSLRSPIDYVITT